MSNSRHNSLWESYVKLFKQACKSQDYSNAQTLIDKAFTDAEHFAEIDKRLIWCIYSLATNYLSCGKNDKASSLYQRLIGLKERVLGRSHPDFSDGLEKLALIQLRAKIYRLQPFLAW